MKLRNILYLTWLLCLLAGHAVADSKAQFAVTDIAGKLHKLADYQGKWVIVNYWATWCPPCLEEMPELVALYDARKNQDVMVIGIAFDADDQAAVVKFADDMLVSYPIVLGDASVIAQIGQAEVLPTTYFYNPRGELVKIKRGLVTKRYIESVITTASPAVKR
ncbi:MAG TPA: TlpA disulfide reductase family protein [Methylophilus sp.]